ncbi:MAG: hypothetical protein NTZ18_04225 [Candidatus Komeilibacteria bacterium]|nr:hypothetical protein [Candidatus Komeilibacteria bacterium]
MLSKKSIIILVIILLVILGLAVALMLFDKSFFSLKPAAPQTNANQQANVPAPQKGAAAETPTVKLSPTEQLIYATARNFAERYGSFSTDSRFTNLTEVQLLATPAFKKVLAGQIGSSAPSKEFYGVSSRALKVNITNLDESGGKAEVTVSLQREESKTGQNNFVFNQDLKLTLTKVGEAWLVNSAVWQGQ